MAANSDYEFTIPSSAALMTSVKASRAHKGEVHGWWSEGRRWESGPDCFVAFLPLLKFCGWQECGWCGCWPWYNSWDELQGIGQDREGAGWCPGWASGRWWGCHTTSCGPSGCRTCAEGRTRQEVFRPLARSPASASPHRACFSPSTPWTMRVL